MIGIRKGIRARLLATGARRRVITPASAQNGARSPKKTIRRLAIGANQIVVDPANEADEADVEAVVEVKRSATCPISRRGPGPRR